MLGIIFLIFTRLSMKNFNGHHARGAGGGAMNLSIHTQVYYGKNRNRRFGSKTPCNFEGRARIRENRKTITSHIRKKEKPPREPPFTDLEGGSKRGATRGRSRDLRGRGEGRGWVHRKRRRRGAFCKRRDRTLHAGRRRLPCPPDLPGVAGHGGLGQSQGGRNFRDGFPFMDQLFNA